MGLSMATRKELSKEVARRYQKASRGEKRDMLNEFCQAIGYNRHYAASILRNLGRQVYWRSPTGEQTVIIVRERRVKKKWQQRLRKYDDAVRDYLLMRQCGLLKFQKKFLKIQS